MSRILVVLSVAVALAVALPAGLSLQLGPGTAPGAPASPADLEDTLHWDSDPDRGFSINGTYSYGCAQRYTETTGVVVKAILYYLTGNADDVFVYVAGESTQATPGAKLDTMRASGLGGGIWKRANLPHPPTIDPYKDFWACVIIRRHPSGQSPLTLDLGPIVPWRGGYITLPSIGPDWYQITDPPFWTDRNVNIRAIVERGGTGVEEVILPSEPRQRLQVKPSVVSDYLDISCLPAGPGPVAVTVRDVLGRCVLAGSMRPEGSPGVRLDVQGLTEGAYLVQVRSAGFAACQKFVVKR